MKSVPNLISYLHEIFKNFSQSLAICFELFSFEMIFNSEIANERAPPIRRRTPRGPARQRAVAVWLPCAAPTPRLKADVGTACRASRQPSSLTPPASQQPASLAPPASPPSRPSRSLKSCRPDRRRAAPTASRRSPVAVTPRRRLRAGEPPFPTVSRALAPCRHRLAE
jgi:hypothetical protein